MGGGLTMSDEDGRAWRAVLQEARPPVGPQDSCVLFAVLRGREVASEVAEPSARLALISMRIELARLMDGRSEKLLLLERLNSLTRGERPRPVGQRLLAEILEHFFHRFRR